MNRIMTALCIAACLSAAGAVELNFDLDSIGAGALSAQLMKTVNEADSWNRKGIDALEKNDLAAAMACFDEALKILPGYSDAINNRGVVKFRKGDIGSAREIWERLAVKEPDYAIASYNLALIQLHEKQPDAAIRLLDRALKADKQLIEAQVRLGAVYLEKGEKTKGLDQLKKAYKAAPNHPDAWSFYAYALVLNNDTAGAINILRKNSDKPEALKLLGRIESSRGNSESASAYLAQAVNSGAEPAILLELAYAQMDAKNCKASLQSLKTYFSRNIEHSAEAFLLAGIASRDCGDAAAATGYFEQGLRNFPQDEILRYNLGLMYFFQKKNDAAESTWKSLGDTLRDPSLPYMRAMNAKRRNDFTAAESFIRQALELDDRAEYRDFLGVVLYRKGDAKGAQAEFRKALRINPDLRSAQLNLALSARSGSELAGAVQALEKKLASCSEDSCADLALQLAALYYCQKQTDRAIEVLAGIKESDRDEQVCRHLAMYYREAHDWNKAIAVLEIAVKKFVTDPQTEYELAETYLLAGYYAKSVERFKALLNKWQQNPWRLYYQLGYAYLEQNELAQAKECFEKSLNSKKENIAARGLLAFVCNQEGDAGRARELWKKNLNDDPSNAALWVNMGLSYERDGKYDEALSYYRKASDLKNSDPQIQINIGNVFTSVGQYTDALQAYKQALNSPKKEIAEYNIFLVYAKKRDKEQAEKELKQLEQDFSSSVNIKRAQSELALWNGDTAGAVAVLEAIGGKEPGDWATLAQVYAAQGKRQKAETCIAKLPSDAQWSAERNTARAQLAFASGNFQEVLSLVLESHDTSFASQYNCALAYYNLKQYADALSTAELLIRRASGRDRADLCKLAGNSAFGLKQWKNAQEWYLQLSNIEANSAVVQYNLAVASYNLGDADNAYRYYQRARELDPKIQNVDIEKRYAAAHGQRANATMISPTDSLYNAAVDLQSGGNDSAALKLYLLVVAKDSLYSMAWNNLGALYGKWGQIDNAINAYQKAVEKKHDIPETYANMVNLYIELEEFGKARQWLIKGQGHNPESELLAGLKEKIIEAEKKSGKGK